MPVNGSSTSKEAPVVAAACRAAEYCAVPAAVGLQLETPAIPQIADFRNRKAKTNFCGFEHDGRTSHTPQRCVVVPSFLWIVSWIGCPR